MKLLTKFNSILTTLLMSIIVVSSPIVFSVAQAETKMMKVYTKFSDEELLDSIKKEYPEAKILKKGTIRVEGMSLKMLIFNSRDNGSLTFSISFAEDISLNKLNKWNADMRFLRAYRDSDGDVVLENDLDTQEGISEKYLVNHIQRLFLGGVLFMGKMNED